MIVEILLQLLIFFAVLVEIHPWVMNSSCNKRMYEFLIYREDICNPILFIAKFLIELGLMVFPFSLEDFLSKRNWSLTCELLDLFFCMFW